MSGSLQRRVIRRIFYSGRAWAGVGVNEFRGESPRNRPEIRIGVNGCEPMLRRFSKVGTALHKLRARSGTWF